jgi:peptidyl-prolyl cis-trans isomerase SurA
LYFLRDTSQGEGPAKGAPVVDYAVFQAGSGADLIKLKASLTGCDQLNVKARGLPDAALQRQTSPEAAVPAGLRGAMAGLDSGESAVVTGATGAAQLLMLCTRRPGAPVAASRDDVRTGLVNRKLTLLAAAYMEELRSQAIIIQQ